MPTVTWDASFAASPANTNAISGGANEIVTLKTAISERLELEMNFKTGTQPLIKAGIAAVCYKGNSTDVAALANMSAGALAWQTTANALQRYSGAAWETVIGPSIPSGSKMIFMQAAAPSGWTQDTSVNDQVIRLTSSTGAGTGGSWTVSGISCASHTLTLAEIPAHTHGISGIAWTSFQSGGTGGLGVGAGGATDSAGSGNGHSHTVASDGSWRPAYVDCIVCTKS